MGMRRIESRNDVDGLSTENEDPWALLIGGRALPVEHRWRPYVAGDIHVECATGDERRCEGDVIARAGDVGCQHSEAGDLAHAFFFHVDTDAIPGRAGAGVVGD